MRNLKNQKSEMLLLRDVAHMVNGRVEGEDEIEIFGIAELDRAENHQISFLTSLKYSKFLSTTKASAVIVGEELKSKRPEGVSFLRVSNPYLAMAEVATHLAKEHDFKREISPLAFVASNAAVGENVGIYPFVWVGEKASIGKGTVLMPGCFIGEGAKVGKDCILHSNVSVREGCVIGDRVILHDGVVIGGDGFGFAPSVRGHLKIPQSGNVVIGNDVEIGANTSIDRATFGSTRIGRGTKIDNLVQIGHNVEIGEGCLIVAQVGISGSTKLGKMVALGGQVGITSHLIIGDGAKIGAQSGVAGDVPAGAIYSGSPAIPHNEWRRTLALLKRLDKMKHKIEELEKELKTLKRNA